ncbi:MAG: YigZ family protein [Micrococcus sp.]|nr:YigZ family protein [Micrococcus sp.]
MTDIHVLAASAQAELVEKKSHFVAHLIPVTSTEGADQAIRSLRAEHPDARHHCTAMIIGEDPPVHRSNDDGEPSGTAGMPMLLALQRAELTDVLAVVIRWFGGIKLGTGGLSRAYAAVVENAIGDARLLRRTTLHEVEIEIPHAEAGGAENAVRTWATAHGALMEDTVYSPTAATLRVLIPPAQVENFSADVSTWSSGTRAPRVVGERRADLSF